MKNFFKKIFDAFKSAFSFLSKKENREKIERGIERLIALADFAAPFIKLASGLTIGKTDDRVSAALDTIRITAREIVDEPNEYKQAGMLLQVTSAVIRNEMIKAILNGTKIILENGQVIRTIEDLKKVDWKTFNTVAQNGYFITDTAEDKSE